jgi:hypothetical protein
MVDVLTMIAEGARGEVVGAKKDNIRKNAGLFQ